MKRVARKGPGARDDVDVPADKVWCGVVRSDAAHCVVSILMVATRSTSLSSASACALCPPPPFACSYPFSVDPRTRRS
jgi:hypothetical protein